MNLAAKKEESIDADAHVLSTDTTVGEVDSSELPAVLRRQRKAGAVTKGRKKRKKRRKTAVKGGVKKRRKTRKKKTMSGVSKKLKRMTEPELGIRSRVSRPSLIGTVVVPLGPFSQRWDSSRINGTVVEPMGSLSKFVGAGGPMMGPTVSLWDRSSRKEPKYLVC